MQRIVIALVLLVAAATTATAEAPSLAERLRAAHGKLDWSHPLAGRLSENGAAPVGIDALARMPVRHDVVLLGEVHDNPVHHELRAMLLAQGLLAGPRPAVVMEHVRADQQEAVDVLQGNDIAPTTAALLAALDWPGSGWGPAAMFEPLFAVMLGQRMPILAGNPAHEQVREVARGGLGKLDTGARQRLGLEVALEPALEEALLVELEASHCGLVPKAAFAGMAGAQRYRDAYMAAALLFGRGEQGRAVLLAGNGHVRRDRGVPWHIRRMAPDARVLAVVLVEVVDGGTEPAAYLPLGPDGKPAADIVVFTPRIERPDPCVEMRRRMGR